MLLGRLKIWLRRTSCVRFWAWPAEAEGDDFLGLARQREVVVAGDVVWRRHRGQVDDRGRSASWVETA